MLLLERSSVACPQPRATVRSSLCGCSLVSRKRWCKTPGSTTAYGTRVRRWHLEAVSRTVSPLTGRNADRTRKAVIFSLSTLSGAFSGLIAYAIGEKLTKANSGRSPWSWLLLIEGVIAIFAGLIVMVLLPPFPDRMRNGKNWLFSKEEINLAIQRTTSECFCINME